MDEATAPLVIRRSSARRAVLLVGATGSALAALLHIAIILGGPSWYRFFGAGERMARLAEHGAPGPAFLTAQIAAMLTLWALYGFAGAGVLRRLPLQDGALVVIAAAYLLGGLLGVPVVLLVDHPYARELAARMPFMITTSFLCIVLGASYAVGSAFTSGPDGEATPARAPTRDLVADD